MSVRNDGSPAITCGCLADPLKLPPRGMSALIGVPPAMASQATTTRTQPGSCTSPNPTCDARERPRCTTLLSTPITWITLAASPSPRARVSIRWAFWGNVERKFPGHRPLSKLVIVTSGRLRPHCRAPNAKWATQPPPGVSVLQGLGRVSPYTCPRSRPPFGLHCSREITRQRRSASNLGD